MPYENYINLSNEELDKPIYRIFPINRFLKSLKENTNTLVKPKKWDDPFENLLLSSKMRLGDEITSISAKDDVFAQCWTLHRETDAMWRIYSSNKDGIRVRSTPRKILEALKKQSGKFANVSCFIGKASYESKNNLIESFKKIDLFNTNGSGIAKSLLIKRTEFSHEKEMRLIYVSHTGSNKDDVFNYKADINDIYDRLLFDPRMDTELREAYKNQIFNLGYKGEIRRSVLYDLPPQMTI